MKGKRIKRTDKKMEEGSGKGDRQKLSSIGEDKTDSGKKSTRVYLEQGAFAYQKEKKRTRRKGPGGGRGGR